jgi:GNAT superfamily N-acetyltransferase
MSDQGKTATENTVTDKSFASRTEANNGIRARENGKMILDTTKVLQSTSVGRYTYRPATMNDLENAVKLFNLCSNHMIGRNEVTVSDVRAEWILQDFDLETATRVAVDKSGKLIGYVEVWDIDELPVDIWVWGRVHPDHEGRGIGTTLMKWAEIRARQALGRVPDDIKVAMRSGIFSNYEPGLELFRNRGMRPIRRFYTMAIDLNEQPPAAQWPDGITIRPMSGIDEARKVIAAVDDAFKDHWGYVEQPFEQELERWLHFMNHNEGFDPNLWYLAMDGDEIAGVSLCTEKSREDPAMAWISTLGVRRPWRRQGLGLALLHHSFGEFYHLGKAQVGLGVDATSLTGATRLYERAGMHPIRQFNTYELVLRPGRDISTQELEA